MDIVQAIVLGLVQGLTEFIPVSSSGHLVLAQAIFGQASDQLFVESLDIGTTLALIIFFWPRIMNLFRQVVKQKDYRLARNILITCIPAGAIGFVFASAIENNTALVNPLVVALMLGMVGIMLIIVERLPKRGEVSDGAKLSWRRALVIGVAQAFALIPGVSRSGSTIIAGRVMGLKAEPAAEYSFMVAIPIMLGLIAKLLLKSSDRAYIMAHLAPVVIANIAAFASGILAIGFLLRYLSKHSLAVFGWYRVALAIAVLLIILVQ